MKMVQQADIFKNPLVIVAVIIVLFSASVMSQLIIDKRSQVLNSKYIFLPDVDVVSRFTLGFDKFIADVYWLRCVQYAGEKKYTGNGLTWMYRSLDLITTLDNKFETAYLFGGIILASENEFVDESISILKKGMKNLPDRWRFPFYIGFNYFFFLQQFELAADYIIKASEISGAPPYLPFLATRLLAEANKPDTALVFLEKMYNQSQDPVMRQKIEDRMKRVILEKDLLNLERAVGEYRAIFGKTPESLNDLAKQGLIKKKPVEPYGGYYYVDRTTGEVRSSKIKERLKLYR